MEPVTTQAQPLPLTEARALAARDALRERVLVYITRRASELLVFEHTPEYLDAGIQVPAGGLEPGEHPEQAALREAFEETGLSLIRPMHLRSLAFTRGTRTEIYHFYWLIAPLTTPDSWEHHVNSHDEDSGMTFLCRFASIAHPDLIPGYGYEAAIPPLKELLKEKNV